MIRTKNDGILLEQLSSQYRLYRGEVRIYLGFAAGSASLLVLLVMGELTVAKGNPIFAALLPVSAVSYAALVCLLKTYAQIAASYSELIELQMNVLLGTDLFIFENHYVGPKPGRGEVFPFNAIWVLTAAMPVLAAVYGIWQIVQIPKYADYRVWLLVGFVLLSGILLYWSKWKITNIRKQTNVQLLQEWKQIRVVEERRQSFNQILRPGMTAVELEQAFEKEKTEIKGDGRLGAAQREQLVDSLTLRLQKVKERIQQRG